jgi:3'-5' exoribonuclease
MNHTSTAIPMKVGDKIHKPFLVVESGIRTTKAGKPYAAVKLYDGAEHLTANLWDWSKPNAPDVGSVALITGTITEYLGQKQVSVDEIRRDLQTPVEDFAPRGDVNIYEQADRLLQVIHSVKHQGLSTILGRFFSTYITQLKTAPGAKQIHHAYQGGLLQHIVSVATTADHLAQALNANRDLCIAGALVHDLGKMYTYKLDKSVITVTEHGELHDHIMLGTWALAELTTGFPREHSLLVHMILSHHGQLEWGSPVTPRFIEAVILHHADMLDSAVQSIRERSAPETLKTEKIWSLGNREMYTDHYIATMLGGAPDDVCSV